MDSGELVDEPAVGVIATDSLDDLLALDADCVSYFAAVSGREGSEVVEQISAMLASGKNVVMPSYHALFHPPTLDDASRTSWKLRADKGTAPCWLPVSRRASPPTFSRCMLRV